jgi:hypothetical protein
MRPDDGGGGESVFSGIDPAKLNATINSVRQDQETLEGRASYYKTQLAYYGIGTPELGDVLKVAGWARDELPMLTRRYHLALAADEPYPSAPKGSLMVSINEGMVGQKATAERNGKELAERFKKDFSGDNSAALFAELEANADDADFVKAFYKALGPDKLVWLSNEMADDPYDDYYDKHPDALTHDRNLIAKTLGTFSKLAFEGETAKEKQASWNKWFDKFAMDPQRGFRPDRLMPLLAGGSYDKDFLVSLGDRVFSKDRQREEPLGGRPLHPVVRRHRQEPRGLRRMDGPQPRQHPEHALRARRLMGQVPPSRPGQGAALRDHRAALDG